MADQPTAPRCRCRYAGWSKPPLPQGHCKHLSTQEDGFCDPCRKAHKGRHCNDEVRHG